MATTVYHPATDEWVVIPWGCSFPGRLTPAEARRVLTEHKHHPAKECRIGRTARRVLRIPGPTK